MIGQGSYGQVHLVVLPGSRVKGHRLFAMKVQKWRPGMEEDFAQEIRINKMLADAAAANTSGSNRVCVALATFVGTETWHDGMVRGYMIMPAAIGTLRDYLKGRLWVTPTSVARCFSTDMFEGIAFIHSLGIWHRDLKPNNMLLMEDSNARLRVKLADFGMSFQQKPGRLMRRTPAVAAPLCRAPELLLAKDNRLVYDGQKVDIWAAGLVMTEMLGSNMLIDCEDEMAILTEIVRRLGNITEEIWPDVSKLAGLAVSFVFARAVRVGFWAWVRCVGSGIDE